MNMRISKKLPLGALLLMVLVPGTSTYAAPCTTTGGAVNLPVAVSACEYEPDVYSYSATIYQLGLCTSIPGAPTSASAANLASCTTVYDNPAGVTVSVSARSTPVNLSGGTVAVPPAGSYGYGYVVLGNTLSIAASITFSGSVNGQASGSGTICRTANANFNTSSNPLGTNLTSICGNSSASPGTVSERIDTIVDHGLIYSDTFSVVGVNDLSVYLLEPSGVSLANGTARSGVTNRIFGIQTFSAPVIVPANPTNLDVGFKSTGLTIENVGGNRLKFIAPAFAVKITTK